MNLLTIVKPVITKMKSVIISFNNNRTKPDGLIFYRERYWSEHTPCSINFFLYNDNYPYDREEFKKTYRYEWHEYRQSYWGVWKQTNRVLKTNTSIRGLL